MWKDNVEDFQETKIDVMPEKSHFFDSDAMLCHNCLSLT